MIRSIHFDADEGDDDAAQAVDEHVAGQHFAGAHGLVLDAAHGQRGSGRG